MDVDDFACLAYRGLRDGGAACGGIDDALRGDQRWNEESPMLEHHRDGLLVQEDAVFDRANPRSDRGLDAGRALSVSHDRDPGRLGLGRHDSQLVVPEMAVARIVAR